MLVPHRDRTEPFADHLARRGIEQFGSNRVGNDRKGRREQPGGCHCLAFARRERSGRTLDHHRLPAFHLDHKIHGRGELLRTERHVKDHLLPDLPGGIPLLFEQKILDQPARFRGEVFSVLDLLVQNGKDLLFPYCLFVFHGCS